MDHKYGPTDQPELTTTQTHTHASPIGGAFLMEQLVNALGSINATLRKIAHRLEEIEKNTRKDDHQ